MKLSVIARRLRMASAELSAVATLDGTDWPDESVPQFIMNFVLDSDMFPRLLRTAAKEHVSFAAALRFYNSGNTLLLLVGSQRQAQASAEKICPNFRLRLFLSLRPMWLIATVIWFLLFLAPSVV